ncbi:MAG TPA: ABC transporter permease [Thermoanaerobaculia bacterium]|jgi:peptide/nickel transport system permease protein|nr:ABC transporter permease [Thermoanaerobaculia bacterium]
MESGKTRAGRERAGLMLGYLARRLVQMVPTALLAATLVFSLIHLIPGDPVEMMLGEGARRTDVEALRHDLGLDRPLLLQYGSFLGGLLRGDLGHSLQSGEPVLALIAGRFPATAELAVASLLIALLVALPLGVLAALHRDGIVDHAARLLSLLGVSVPSIWLGPMLILLFAITWDLLPVSGRGGLASVLLPAVTLGAGLAGLLTRMVRAALADELVRPYLLAARARGLGGVAVVARHALKNALVPVVTVLGLQFGALLTGAILTETIFAWPGVGRLLVESIRLRDYPLLQGAVLLIAFTYLLVNLATDLVYALLDPRIRYGRAS